MQTFFEYSKKVKHALDHHLPVLALESTLITHGLPYPENLETALAVEKIADSMNVVPATIAIMDGKIKIGLNDQELQTLASQRDCLKASTRDIPYIITQKKNAGTTVAATLFCAHAAGIKIFATGGIGGVHHGNSLDISADLIELARTPVAVICAGAKAILDLPRTLEFLETHSVPIIGYQTSFLPAFYSAKTSYPLYCRIDEIKTLADLLKIHWQLKMSSGILITNPITEQDEIASETITPVISAALQSAESKNISGKDVTPFLLSEIAAVTEGKSMAANISLIKNNVRLGAALAAAL